MKKLFLLAAVIAVAAAVLFVACEKHKKATAQTTTENKTETTLGHYPDPIWPPLGAYAKGELNVEHVVATDKQAMYTQYAKDYRYFETQVVLKDFLDSEACDGTVAEITNVFQVVDVTERGADVHVVMFNHAGEQHEFKVIHSFWVEDYVMSDDAIKVTFKDAYEKMMKANIVKPHSRHAVLRKQIGPKACNPQWIFGNSRSQVYVDAVTGDVSAKNPAFDSSSLGAPLGEWP